MSASPIERQPSIRSNPYGFRRDISVPTHKIPANACDSHMHIIGPLDRFPLRETRSLTPPAATVDDYRAVMKTTGFERTVVVQPSSYAKDNECTLSAVESFDGQARAIVVIDAHVDEEVLAAMHSRGARGARVQRVVAGGASIEDIAEIASKISPFGWHLQLFLDASELAELKPVLARLPVDIVFDHMAIVRDNASLKDPGFKVLLDLLDSGKAWVKLANAFSVPDAERARTLIRANHHQVLWGSDWPHVGYRDQPPDDGKLVDSLFDWAETDDVARRILVDNPDRLYFR